MADGCIMGELRGGKLVEKQGCNFVVNLGRCRWWHGEGDRWAHGCLYRDETGSGGW